MKIPNIVTTSWTDDFFALFIYNAVKYIKPELCVELGTYAGYSAYCIATALKENGKGKLECYDLWEKYPFRCVTKLEAEGNLKDLPIELRQQDAKTAYKDYRAGVVNFLMVDISNDGAVYKQILTDWYWKLSPKATVMLEGGCKERDEIEWMTKYGKIPIRKVLKDKELKEMYTFVNVGNFPSLTIAQRKE